MAMVIELVRVVALFVALVVSAIDCAVETIQLVELIRVVAPSLP